MPSLAPVMPLVEIICGVHTSDAVADIAHGLAIKLGKTPIAVRNAPGFVVNRLLLPMINEAVFVLQEGLAGAVEIDAGMTLGARHPIGPLAEMVDAGLLGRKSGCGFHLY